MLGYEPEGSWQLYDVAEELGSIPKREEEKENLSIGRPQNGFRSATTD